MAYVLVGLVLAVIGGTVIDKLNMQEYVEDFVFEANHTDGILEEMTKKERFDYAQGQVREIIKRVWLYILVGVGVGAIIHNWIPQSL